MSIQPFNPYAASLQQRWMEELQKQQNAQRRMQMLSQSGDVTNPDEAPTLVLLLEDV